MCTLSVIVPTYNRAHFLEKCLEALVPQIRAAGKRAELIILDNASADHTQAVTEPYANGDQIRYVRHAENFGVIYNISIGPREFANGKYVWILGDHNLIMPNALERIINELDSHPKLELFYTNFRCAIYPDQWPDSCPKGFYGDFDYLGNHRTETQIVPKWGDLLDAKSGFCTQLYAQIVRTKIWSDYWIDRPIPETFRCGLSTYPHTWMLAETSFDKPARFLHEPALTIFNGAQHWGDPTNRLNVLLYGFSDLAKLFKRKGFSEERFGSAVQYTRWRVNKLMKSSFQVSGKTDWILFTRSSYIAAKRCPWALSGILATLFWNSPNPILRAMRKVYLQAQKASVYLFKNCRPARWLRKLRES
ncbi:glycosyltransferase family 2 protein [Cerasicoccus maritimus]|uniref:glycosyltransferase family 2 protein n=1 Tax=Cerasicoccus maritimus TaxID=490089 RepID=UPI0028528002|nr:glycosyltransferase family 2 protein [Cerasicoccus maritimus]